MPVYAYECESHGSFDLLRPMSQSGADAPCPECGEASQRTITVPQVLSMGPVQRNAAERNERSRHAPRVSGSSCAHHHRAPSHAKPPTGRDGKPALQRYSGPRPWVVEHR